MVAHFKVRDGLHPAHEITTENVEELLGKRAPWFRRGPRDDEDRHYAVCPYCDTPIQLIGLYKRRSDSPRPFGRHAGKRIEGFSFDALDLEYCPFLTKNRNPHKNARREMGPAARQLIELAVSEFDRIVLILRSDFGFPFSNTFAERMLDRWFGSQGYLYVGAHLRNLPWMVAYFAPAQNLFGQLVGNNSELADQIRTKVQQARISESGRLEKGEKWFSIELQCLHHKVEEMGGALVESLSLRVQDFTETNEPEKAPTLYRKRIEFNPDRFESMVNTPQDSAKRNTSLLERAQTIAAKWIRR